MAAGIYNSWIEKSLGKLADLMPGRYAKFEASSGLIASIDRYAYRLPKAPETSADETEVGAATDSGDPVSQPDSAIEVESAHEDHAGQIVAGR